MGGLENVFHEKENGLPRSFEALGIVGFQGRGGQQSSQGISLAYTHDSHRSTI